MSWARYDDELTMNRKVGYLLAQGQRGLAALGLHLACNTYCRHNGTGGWVEPHVPRLLAGSAGESAARLLEQVGMFDLREDAGWMIHDYADYHDPSDPNPDRSAADRKRDLTEKRKAAGALGGKQRASNASSKREAVLKQTSSPVPVPVPDVSSNSSSSSSVRQADAAAAAAEHRSFEAWAETVCDIAARIRAGRKRPVPTDPRAWIATCAKAMQSECYDDLRAAWTLAVPADLAGQRLADGHSFAAPLDDELEDEPAAPDPERVLRSAWLLGQSVAEDHIRDGVYDPDLFAASDEITNAAPEWAAVALEAYRKVGSHPSLQPGPPALRVITGGDQ